MKEGGGFHMRWRSRKNIASYFLITLTILTTTFSAGTYISRVNSCRTDQTRKLAELLEKIEEYNRSVDSVTRSIKGASPYVGDQRARHLATLFLEYSAKSSIPVRVFLLIAKVESDFRNIRSKNDFGIMQINRFWLKKYGVSPQSALEDRKNIELFVRIMKKLKDHPLSYYHSWTPQVRKKYERRLKKVATRLL